MKFTREDLAQKVLRGEIRLQPRTQPALLPMEERVTSFREVVLGLTERQARAEAQRCLQCGLCSECLACVYACGVNAIDHNLVAREEKIDVGAVILAPGYQAYQAALSREYGFGRYPNVITALQFERLALGVWSNARACATPIGSRRTAAHRVLAVRWLTRPVARLLLGGVLHVRDEGSRHRQRASTRSRRARLHDGHARVQ